MREITDHKVNPVNDTLRVTVIDDPGPGGANHVYAIEKTPVERHPLLTVVFQNGPINEAGVNGVTHEVLLAIVADRLRSFVEGAYPDAFTASALVHCEQALDNLKMRTQYRMAIGVEGTMKA